MHEPVEGTSEQALGEGFEPSADRKAQIAGSGAIPQVRTIARRSPNLDRRRQGWEAESDGVGGDRGLPLYLDRLAQQLTG